MRFLQPILQPVLRIARGLTRIQRIGLGVVVAALIGLLLIVSIFGHGSDTAVAYSGLSTEDEAAIVAKLKEVKIPYELVDGGTIRVPNAQLQDAKLATVGMGLGGKPAAGTGFELFNQPSFGQTEFTQKVNYQRALETELARSIDRMDAIDSSTVHLVMPQPSLFSSQQADTTASIMLKLKPGKHLDTAQARSISNLVVGSVEGLKPLNVNIIDINGNTLTPDDGKTTPGALTSKQLETQRGFETTTERNLQAMLDGVLGTGKATVRVSAAMNWDTSEQTNESYSPNDPLVTPILTNHAITSSSTGGGTAAGGVPGAASNNGAVPTYQGAPGAGGASASSDINTAYQLNRIVQKVVRAPGAVSRLSVSVMLDDDPTNPTPALSQTVQNAVNAAVGIDPARGDVLTVTSLAFNRSELLANQLALADAAQREQIMSYLHLAALVVGPLLMLLVLFFILSRGRGMSAEEKARIKAAKKAAKAAAKALAKEGPPKVLEEILAARGDATTTPVKGKNGEVAQPMVEDPQKVYIREQIMMLGKTQPATVAQLIQTWMDEDRRN
jgi:flagellar M-ring protein FliF